VAVEKIQRTRVVEVLVTLANGGAERRPSP